MNPHHESAARGPDARMVDRLLFFSDAVFAIVLTLLILDLHPPSLVGISGMDAWTAMSRVAPHFYSFVLSFGIVAMWWALHMRVTRNFARFDVATAVFNLVFLFTITLMPFAASLLGQSGWNNPEAFVVYWSINGAASVSMALMCVFATRGGGKFLVAPLSFGARAFIIYQNFVPAIVFSASIWLALRGDMSSSALATMAIPVLIAFGRIFYREPKAARSA